MDTAPHLQQCCGCCCWEQVSQWCDSAMTAGPHSHSCSGHLMHLLWKQISQLFLWIQVANQAKGEKLEQGRCTLDGSESGQEILDQIGQCKGPDGMHPWVLKELADVTARTLSFILDQLATERSAQRLEESRCHSCLQEGLLAYCKPVSLT